MTEDAKRNDHRAIKRVRQACSNCRNKKVRCSGERPICAQCHRSGQSCVYVFDITVSDSLTSHLECSDPVTAAMSHNELLDRLKTLERRLDEITSNQTIVNAALINDPPGGKIPNSQGFYVPKAPATRRSHSFDRLPRYSVLSAAVDNYFDRCHNQPYLLFHEQRFRKQFQDATLPQFLLFALLATVLRFSDDSCPESTTEQAAESYAKLAWEGIMQRWMDIDEEQNICAVQAMLLLSLHEYTVNRRQKAWMKTGLAVRLALDLSLNREPSCDLHPFKQEERRRVFWTAYLMDRFATCSRGRPPILRDEDCKLFLPCDELDLRHGILKPSHKLSVSLGEMDHSTLNPFMTTIIMTSLLGRCTRYMLDEDKDFDNLAPWDSKSESAAIASQLLLFEATIGQGNKLDALIKKYYRIGDAVDQQRAGHVVMSRILFHLCYCILHHPFLLRRRLSHFPGKVPPLLLGRLLDSSRMHAIALCSVVHAAKAVGCNTGFAIYSYCLGVCGSILAIYSHSNDSVIATESTAQFIRIANYLRENARYWKICTAILSGLENIRSKIESCRVLCSPSQIDVVELSQMEYMWAVLDMASLSTPATNSHKSARRRSHAEAFAPDETNTINTETPPENNLGLTGVSDPHLMDHIINIDFDCEGLGSDTDLSNPFSYCNWNDEANSVGMAEPQLN